MKAHLLYRDRDLEAERALPANERALCDDLEVNTVLAAMARGDTFLLSVAKHVVLGGLQGDLDTILYRQAVLDDCVRHRTTIESMYRLAVEALETKRRQWLGILGTYPGGILSGAVSLLEMFMGMLATLRGIADEHAASFASEGFARLFEDLKAELTDEYLAVTRAYLAELRFGDGVVVSAELGPGNAGTNYVLRPPPKKEPNWLRRIIARKPPGYSLRIADRDEAGFRALGELRDRGIHLVANAVAQASDHVLSYFVMLRTELAFYLGCVNLHDRLKQKGVPVCFPVPTPLGTRAHSCVGLRDVSLALSIEGNVVGNDLAADGRDIVIITGANQGGKSTFLRGFGLAQLMMQCGMFVAAESFRADVCRGLLTHYKRDEDATMKSGKFAEELSRMSRIVDAVVPGSMVLFNESFAATNEREGSEVADQIVRALLEARVTVFFVTHLYGFAHGRWEGGRDTTVFLRAERELNGRRTFKLVPGEPLETSFGADLYEQIFEAGRGQTGQGGPPRA